MNYDPNRTWGVSEDTVMLARAMKKILTSDAGSVWWYGGDDGPDGYVPTSLGVDTTVELTEEEALAVQRVMRA